MLAILQARSGTARESSASQPGPVRGRIGHPPVGPIPGERRVDSTGVTAGQVNRVLREAAHGGLPMDLMPDTCHRQPGASIAPGCRVELACGVESPRRRVGTHAENESVPRSDLRCLEKENTGVSCDALRAQKVVNPSFQQWSVESEGLIVAGRDANFNARRGSRLLLMPCRHRPRGAVHNFRTQGLLAGIPVAFQKLHDPSRAQSTVFTHTDPDVKDGTHQETAPQDEQHFTVHDDLLQPMTRFWFPGWSGGSTPGNSPGSVPASARPRHDESVSTHEPRPHWPTSTASGSILGARKYNNDRVVTGPDTLVVIDGAGDDAEAGITASVALAGATMGIARRAASKTPSALAIVDEASAAVLNARADTTAATITVLQVVAGDQPRGELAWLGDSPAFLLRDGLLQQLTRPHNQAQELAESRLLSYEAAQRTALSNVLTRGLGVVDGAPEMLTVALLPGDRVLVASDGVLAIPLEALGQSLGQGDDARAAVNALLDAAIDFSAPDNVAAAVLVVDVPEWVASSVIRDAAADDTHEPSSYPAAATTVRPNVAPSTVDPPARVRRFRRRRERNTTDPRTFL